jgi:hypothetical protein
MIRHARAAVNNQKHRAGPIPAFDEHPLWNAIDGYPYFFRDTGTATFACPGGSHVVLPKSDSLEGHIDRQKPNKIHAEMESDRGLQAAPQPQIRHGQHLDAAEEQDNDRVR